MSWIMLFFTIELCIPDQFQFFFFLSCILWLFIAMITTLWESHVNTFLFWHHLSTFLENFKLIFTWKFNVSVSCEHSALCVSRLSGSCCVCSKAVPQHKCQVSVIAEELNAESWSLVRTGMCLLFSGYIFSCHLLYLSCVYSSTNRLVFCVLCIRSFTPRQDG